MANAPSTYFDITAIDVRVAETTPNIGFGFNNNGGMNYSSTQPGIGIATDAPNLTGNPEQWTLLDQEGAARNPQKSMYIGNPTPTPCLVIVNGTNGNPSATPGDIADATLATLAEGWKGVYIP